MRIDILKAVFQDAALQQILLEEIKDPRDVYLSKNMLKCVVDSSKENYVHLFLEVIEEQKETQYNPACSRLLDAFIGQLNQNKTKITISDAIQQSLDRVNRCYKKGIYKEPITTPGIFPDQVVKVSEFLDVANDEFRPHDMEQLVIDHASEDPEMKFLKEARDKRHNEGFSYDVVTLEKIPKLVVCGVPRSDRDNCLAEFYKMLVKEEVPVVIALNTFSDWEKAIAYYDAEVLKQLPQDFEVSASEPKVLYKGTVATNIPKAMRKKAAELGLDHEELMPYRVRLEERTLTVQHKEKRHTATHLHFVNWPDHEEAPDLKALGMLLDRQTALGGSAVVHCQGGIGRTLGYLQNFAVREKLRAAYKKADDVNSLEINLPELTYALKRQAPRLGGAPKGERLAQVFRMAHDFAKTL